MSMSKCKHIWDEVGRTFTAPSFGSFKATGLSAIEMLYFQFGITNIELRCRECGDIKIIDKPGKVER